MYCFTRCGTLEFNSGWDERKSTDVKLGSRYHLQRPRRGAAPRRHECRLETDVYGSVGGDGEEVSTEGEGGL